MKNSTVVKHTSKEGIVDGLPLVIGFMPIAMAFGILSKATGFSIIETVLFSALVFAGSSQFIALNLLLIGAGMGEIILTTLLINFRHFLMSTSLAVKLPKNIKKWKPLIAFGIIDEIFSIASFKEGELSKEYILSLQFMGYSAWVGGTLLGFLVGGIIPEIVETSMSVALYAMFVAILIPEIKKSLSVIVLVCIAGLINTIGIYVMELPQAWSIIISIILVSYLGIYIYDEGAVVVNE